MAVAGRQVWRVHTAAVRWRWPGAEFEFEGGGETFLLLGDKDHSRFWTLWPSVFLCALLINCFNSIIDWRILFIIIILVSKVDVSRIVQDAKLSSRVVGVCRARRRAGTCPKHLVPVFNKKCENFGIENGARFKNNFPKVSSKIPTHTITHTHTHRMICRTDAGWLSLVAGFVDTWHVPEAASARSKSRKKVLPNQQGRYYANSQEISFPYYRAPKRKKDKRLSWSKERERERLAAGSLIDF